MSASACAFDIQHMQKTPIPFGSESLQPPLSSIFWSCPNPMAHLATPSLHSYYFGCTKLSSDWILSIQILNRLHLRRVVFCDAMLTLCQISKRLSMRIPVVRRTLMKTKYNVSVPPDVLPVSLLMPSNL